MNASVTSFSNFYCIVVYSGLYQQTYSIMAGLLSDRSLRKFLLTGEEAVDDGSYPRLSRREAYVDLRETGAERADKPALDLTYLLSQLTVIIVTCHELGHIFGGHLQHSLTKNHMSEDAVQVDAQGIRRALEIDADVFGSLASALLMCNIKPYPRWSDLPLDLDMALRFLFVSCYATYSIMDLFGPVDPLVTRKVHPAPLLRIYIVGLIVSNALPVIIPASEREAIWDQASSSVRAVELALLATAGGSMMPEEALQYESAGSQLWDEHLGRWSTIKSSLDRKRLDVFPWSPVLP